jgi:hypothetical protein
MKCIAIRIHLHNVREKYRAVGKEGLPA